MTDATSRKRQPRGTTVGGQFATESKGESAVSLAGMRETTTSTLATPYGTAYSSTEIAPGITRYDIDADTSVFSIDSDKESAIPHRLRAPRGFYHEGSTDAIARYYLSEFMDPVGDERSAVQVRAVALEDIKERFPLGHHLITGERPSVRERTFEEVSQDNPYEFVTTGRSSSISGTPRGYITAEARRASDGMTIYALIPDVVATGGGGMGHMVRPMKIDASEYLNVTQAVDTYNSYQDKEPEPQVGTQVDLGQLTAGQSPGRTQRELDTQYLWPDGATQSLGERIASRPVSGKRVIVDEMSGRITHTVTIDGKEVPVYKGVFDAAQAQDATEPGVRESIALGVARDKHEVAKRHLDAQDPNQAAKIAELAAKREAAEREYVQATEVEMQRRSKQFAERDRATTQAISALAQGSRRSL